MGSGVANTRKWSARRTASIETRPCAVTVILSVPSGSRVSEVTVASVPTVCRSVAVNSSVPNSRWRTTTSSPLPATAASTDARDSARPTNSDVSLPGKSVMSSSGSIG